LALYNLGHLYQLMGRWSDATAAFGQAVSEQPEFVQAWQKLAAMELRANRRDQALAAAEQAVALAPDEANGWFHLADALGRFERWAESQQALERCLQLRPQFPEALNNLGLVRKSQNDLAGAIAAFEAALQQAPPSDPGNATIAAETCANLAQLELDAHHHQAATHWCERAVAFDINNAKVQFTQGNVLNALGNYEAAASALRRALELQPYFPEALNNLGNILLNLQRHGESIATFERAIAQRPAYAEALANLANAQREARFPDLAEAALLEAIRLKPDFAAAHSNLGNAYFDQGKVVLALASYRRGIELGQDDRDFVPNYLFALNYSPSASDATIDAETRRLAAEHFGALLQQPTRDGSGHARDPARRLRLGYVSPDFWMHPVARFMLPLLEHHNRERFEVFAYSSRHLKDGFTAEIAQRVEHWRELHALDDDALAALIGDDGIDVLVDLTMYARDCRPGLFARKPAPLQISYLAYVGTTGLAAMDYRITDVVLDPPEAPPLPFVEQPLRLLRCWWSFVPPAHHHSDGDATALPAQWGDHLWQPQQLRQGQRRGTGPVGPAGGQRARGEAVAAHQRNASPPGAARFSGRARLAQRAGDAGGLSGRSRLHGHLRPDRHRPRHDTLCRRYHQLRCPVDGGAAGDPGRCAQLQPWRGQHSHQPGPTRVDRPQPRRIHRHCSLPGGRPAAAGRHPQRPAHRAADLTADGRGRLHPRV